MRCPGPLASSILRVGRSGRSVALCTAALMGVSLVGASGPATALPPAQVGASAKAVRERPDIQTAMAAARAQYQRVEALSERSETSTTWANPDGSLSTELAMGPIRLQNKNGLWADVDLTLATSNGVLAPKFSPVPFVLSGGGTTVVASENIAGGTVQVGWPATLPAPAISGEVATYANVSPGVDLVVQALRTGFNVDFVVHSKPSTTLSLPLTLTLKGLTASQQPDGSIQLTDTKGNPVGSGGVPVMLGATVLPGTNYPAKQKVVLGGLSTSKPGTLTSLASPSGSTAGTTGGSATTMTWTLAPDMTFLSDPSVTYPVTVDPSYNFAISSDTYVKSNLSTSQYSATRLYIGTPDSGTTKARTLLHLNAIPTAFLGDYISNAYLQMYNSFSSSCAASLAPVYLYKVNPWTSSTVWSNQPTVGALQSTSNFAHAGPNNACDSGAYDNMDLTNVVREWADGTGTVKDLELRSTETDLHGWKEFFSVDAGSGIPHIYVTYWTRPSTPAKPTLSPAGYDSGTTTYRTNQTQPTLSARVSSPSGNTVQARFEVYQGSTLKWSGLGNTVTSGSESTVVLPSGSGLLADASYVLRVWAVTGGAVSQDWSDYVRFVLDTTAPTGPTVASTAYPSAGFAATRDPGTFTFSGSSSDVDRFSYRFDAGPITTITKTGASTDTTITPPGGWHTLNVRALDLAGNASGWTGHAFGATGMTSPDGQASTLRFLTLNAAAPTGETGVTFRYRTSPTATWASVPPTSVTQSGSPISSWPIATVTSGSQVNAPTQLVWDMSSTLATDGPVYLQAVFNGATSPTTTNESIATLDQNAYGLAYVTADVGVGSVSLQTGNLAISASDASVASFGGDLTVSRTFNSRQPAASTADGSAPIFGPGWTSALASEVSDWRLVEDLGSQVRLTDSSGGLWYFVKTLTGYAPVADAVTAGYSFTSTGSSGNYTFTLHDAAGATTTINAVDSAWSGTPSSSTPQPYRVTSTHPAGVAGTSGYVYNSDGTPKLLIAPAPPGITCTPTSIVVGCRALAFTYTGSGASTRLTKVTLKTTTTNGTAISTDIACYTFEAVSPNRLSQVWDPRLGGSAGWGATCGSPIQAIAYSYDANGRVASIAPSFLAAVNISYDGTGRFATSSRAHSSTYGGATLTNTVKYGVTIAATSSGDSTHPDLSASRVAAWGQSSVPVDAAVVFGPGASLSATDLSDGTVYAWDADGHKTNTSVYAGTGQDGWRLDATDYDALGNTVRTMTPGNRDRALNPGHYSAQLADLGLGSATGAEIADALSTRTVYADDGIDVTDVYGPAHRMIMPDSSSGIARTHDHTDYGTIDYPTINPSDWTVGGPQHSPTRTTQGASLSLSATTVGETDLTETRLSYGLSNTDHPGWDLRSAMAMTLENGGSDITTQTRYDANGNTIEQRQPSAAGSTTNPGTRVTTYYATGAHNPATCTSTALYGQVCSEGPGSQPTTSGLPGLPTTTYSYDALLRPTVTTETVTPAAGGNSTRTTTTAYRNSGASTQVDSVTITGGVGTAVPATSYGYDSNGLPTTITGNSVTQALAYDDFGHAVSYTDASGARTSVARDNRDQLASLTWTETDGTTILASQSFAYVDPSSGDHRRQLATITDSVVGAINGSYDPSTGSLVSQTLSSGLTQSFEIDPTGAATSTNWTNSSDVFLSDAKSSDSHDRWRIETVGGAGAPAWNSRSFAYDQAGRLNGVQEQVDQGCLTRTYALDVNSNRTNSTAYPPDGSRACSSSTTPSRAQSLTYDNADRLLPSGSAAGIAYDAWGRITTLPAVLTSTPNSGNSANSYFTNDLVRSLTQGSATHTWSLDPSGRLASMSTTGLGSTALTNHYSDSSSDSPTWTLDTDTGGTVTTRRYVRGFTGLLAEASTVGSATSVSVQLTGLHGDVLRTTSLSATGSPDGNAVNADEFGLVNNGAGATATGSRYGWLGSFQRSTETGAVGLVLMGARLYSPVIGRFLTVDSVYGGNPNAYTYPVDPVGQSDTTGRCPCEIYGYRWVQRVEWTHWQFGGANNWDYVLVRMYIRDSHVSQILGYQVYVAVFGIGGQVTVATSGADTAQWLIGSGGSHVFTMLLGWGRTNRSFGIDVDLNPLIVWHIQPPSYLWVGIRVKILVWRYKLVLVGWR